jgi:hypothetical protein
MAIGVTGPDLIGIPPSLSLSPKDRQPTNTNYLNPSFFRFYLQRVPGVTYFCQAVNLPGLSVPSISQSTFFADAKQVGAKPSYEDLTVRFIVDEDLSNWREIHDWIKSFANSDNFNDFITPEKDHFSDATLSLTTSGMNSNVEVQFKNCFPTSISSLDFDSAITDLESMTAEVTFSYDTYKITKL